MISLLPQTTIDDAARLKGARILTTEVVFSAACDAIVVGTILTAFALQLGASPAQVGLLATVAFWAQLLQGPAVMLVERLRRRKLIAVVGSLVSSIAPAVMVALAFTAASQGARISLVAAVALYSAAGAFAGCAWNAWTHDLIPDDVRGRFTGNRSRLAMIANVSIGLAAALALDAAGEGDQRDMVFAGLFVLAFVAQLLSAAMLARAPEPMMPPAASRPKLAELLAQPLRDSRFRPFVRFTASWQFAVNLAQPYFTVFFLQQLGLSISFVMVLTVVAQLANIWALKRWGPLVDRLGEKSVLNLAAPVYILGIAAMAFAAQLGSPLVAAIYLVLLHAIMGVAGAGVRLGTSCLALKLSPPGASAAYLSTNALVSSAAGGLAPLLGGVAAEFFSSRRLGLSVEWEGQLINGDLLSFQLTGWTFYFVLAALLGLYALHRLAMIADEKAASSREMVQEMLARARARFARPPAVAGAHAPEEVPPEILKV